MKSKLHSAACAIVLLTAWGNVAAAPIDETHDMAADGLLRVSNMAGSIEVKVWDKAEVRITGELGEHVEELEVRATSSGLDVTVRNAQQRHSVDDTVLVLQVPATASLETDSVSADVTVIGLKSASISLDSVSGDFDLEVETARLRADTVSGDVLFRGRAPRMSVETVSGDIDIEGSEGEARVTTVSGDVDFEGASIDDGRFESVSGELDLRMDLLDGASLEAENMSGDVRVALPAGQKAEIRAETFSGAIRSDFGTVKERSDGSGSSLTHRVDDSATSIEIESFSGDITLSSR